MRPRPLPLIAALPLLAGLLGAAPAWAGCDTAQALYRQALAAASPGTKAALLRASIADCPSGLAWLELGRLLLDQGELSQAEAVLGQSLRWTGLPGERAEAMSLLGRVYLGMGREDEARTAWRTSLELRPDPQVEALVRRLDERASPGPSPAANPSGGQPPVLK